MCNQMWHLFHAIEIYSVEGLVVAYPVTLAYDSLALEENSEVGKAVLGQM